MQRQLLRDATTLFLVLAGIFLLSAPTTHAANDITAWYNETQPNVASFQSDGNGGFSGYTDTGVSFRQFVIRNDAALHIERFEMGDHYHYIVNGKIVYTKEQLSQILGQN